MKIFIDCDETLVLTKDSLRNYYLNTVDPNAKIPLDSYSYDWNVWNKNKDIAKQEHKEFITDWAESDYFTTIKPLENAVTSVLKLKKQGHNLSVLTSISTIPLVINRRIDFLCNVFGKKTFDEIICLGLQQSKKQTLKEKKADIFIDDCANFIAEAVDVGTAGILINKTESLPRGAFRAKNWNEVMRIIKTINNYRQNVQH